MGNMVLAQEEQASYLNGRAATASIESYKHMEFSLPETFGDLVLELP